jgi:hypothetical protein
MGPMEAGIYMSDLALLMRNWATLRAHIDQYSIRYYVPPGTSPGVALVITTAIFLVLLIAAATVVVVAGVPRP